MLDLLSDKSSEVFKSKDSIVATAAQAVSFDARPVFDRFQRETDFDEAAARELWRELVRYLVMIGRFPKRGYGMYGPVDVLWHNFVLHTELYQDFCATHLGRFVHHHPCTTEKGSGWHGRYLQFLHDYRLVFDEAPPQHIWPVPDLSGPQGPSSAETTAGHHANPSHRSEAAANRGLFGSMIAFLGLETVLNNLAQDHRRWDGYGSSDGGGGGDAGGGGCGGGCGGCSGD